MSLIAYEGWPFKAVKYAQHDKGLHEKFKKDEYSFIFYFIFSYVFCVLKNVLIYTFMSIEFIHHFT